MGAPIPLGRPRVSVRTEKPVFWEANAAPFPWGSGRDPAGPKLSLYFVGPRRLNNVRALEEPRPWDPKVFSAQRGGVGPRPVSFQAQTAQIPVRIAAPHAEKMLLGGGTPKVAVGQQQAPAPAAPESL